VLGFTLILLGAIGTLVPVIPGVPMILAGVALVGVDHPRIRELRRGWKSLVSRARSWRA
jgi:uncharacterized protein YqgC (DUF456 family)